MSDHETPRRNGILVDTAEEIALAVGRIGYGLIRLPLGLLPPQSRKHMNNALRELSYGFVRLPGEFAEIAGTEIERWANDESTAAPPRTQTIAVETAVETASAATTAGIVTLGATPSMPSAVATRVPIDIAEAPPPTPSVIPGVKKGVTISHIEYDPPGNDLAGEYVLIHNSGDESVDLNGWQLDDGNKKHSYTFPPFVLAPGAEVKLWSKRGNNDAVNLYWHNRGAIWNNSGDTGTLSDKDGNVVSSYTYSGKL